MGWNNPFQLQVWGWPDQHPWQLNVTAGERNATNTCSGGKDIFPLFALTVFHYDPQTIFTCSLILSGAAPWHEWRLHRLPWMRNSPLKTQFLLLCPSAVVSHAHQGWWYFTIFQLPNSCGVGAYMLEQAIGPPCSGEQGFSMTYWILDLQNTISESTSLIISCE